MVFILVIASHTGDRRLATQGGLMQLGIHQHDRVQGEALLVEYELV